MTIMMMEMMIKDHGDDNDEEEADDDEDVDSIPDICYRHHRHVCVKNNCPV